MTSITWKNLATGKCSIKFYRSRDKLNNILKDVKRYYPSEDKSLYVFVKEMALNGKKKEKWQVYGVSYEEQDEKAIFQKYEIVPQDKDYPDIYDQER